jgi:hypothetical protein
MTASEVNNNGFEVERQNYKQLAVCSKEYWIKIGFVEGKGTTAGVSSYSFS